MRRSTKRIGVVCRVNKSNELYSCFRVNGSRYYASSPSSSTATQSKPREQQGNSNSSQQFGQSYSYQRIQEKVRFFEEKLNFKNSNFLNIKE